MPVLFSHPPPLQVLRDTCGTPTGDHDLKVLVVALLPGKNLPGESNENDEAKHFFYHNSPKPTRRIINSKDTSLDTGLLIQTAIRHSKNTFATF